MLREPKVLVALRISNPAKVHSNSSKREANCVRAVIPLPCAVLRMLYCNVLIMCAFSVISGDHCHYHRPQPHSRLEISILRRNPAKCSGFFVPDRNVADEINKKYTGVYSGYNNHLI
jgi:hypothetical protein